MEFGLTRLWNRLYDGVVLAHIETLERLAKDHEIIYVPCHRSHMDYLLLSYAIFRQGYAIPHIAAGINLNLPVVGRFLRKGGAFFIRRSFRGSSLYTVVFTNYLAAIMARGHSIEYFIEGGRSRTGRLLQPKTGMLSMTVRSFLRHPQRPVVFLPVYFGYERVVEGTTYIGELSGKPKEKESVLGLLGTVRKLRERFGRVYVNIGEPVFLSELLDQYDPQWNKRALEDDPRLPWINPAVAQLAEKIMQNINSAAAVAPINLLAVTLLATPRQALPEIDLLRQLELYLALLRSFPYSERVTITDLSPADILGPAPVRDAIPHRLRVRQQCVDAHRGHPATCVAHLSVHRVGAVLAVERERVAGAGRERTRRTRGIAPAGGKRRDHAVGAGRALPPDGAADDHALRHQFAGVLRSRVVQELHRSVARARRDSRLRRRQARIRRRAHPCCQ
jgi:glycerol-3-phosphate O-acyltransferase